MAKRKIRAAKPRRLNMHNDDRLTQTEAEYILAMIEADRESDPDHPQYTKIGKPLGEKLERLLGVAKDKSEKAYLAKNMEKGRKWRPKWRAPRLKLNGHVQMPGGGE